MPLKYVVIWPYLQGGARLDAATKAGGRGRHPGMVPQPTKDKEKQRRMKIQILGTGCPKCIQLTNNVEAAVRDAGIDCEIEKVSDINDILAFGVMLIPALVIDGEVKAVGKVLPIPKIKELLAR